MVLLLLLILYYYYLWPSAGTFLCVNVDMLQKKTTLLNFIVILKSLKKKIML